VTDFPEKRAILSGVGISRIGRRSGIPARELTCEAARAALADAGLVASDLDGMATFGDLPLAEAQRALRVGELAFRGGGFDGAGLLSPVMSACLAVGEGRARHVLVYRTVQMIGGTMLPAGGRSGTPPGPVDPGQRSLASAMGDMGPLLACHAYSAANWLAMHCRRHMHLYGTTREQLGALARNSRRNAGLNPLAAYRAPLSMDEYLASRVVSSPFGLLDCDVPVDGSIAVVVSTDAYARDCPSRPIRVEAIGGAAGATGWVDRPDYPKMASVEAAAQMWSRTDLRPADVDVAELYDGFTFLALAWLEALGLCGEGESGPFVEGGARIALEGELPLNTYGGQLSAGRMHGYWVLHEACLQLRGAAGERQVSGRPEVAVVSAGGGPIAGCMLLTA
jgi:acetyl-CoA acetyltransferase